MLINRLQSNLGDSTSKHREDWELALKTTFTDDQWRNAFILAHKCSISSSIQEISYKLLTNCYFTPAKLHTWYPDTPWWRCSNDTGTMLHIWWECPSLQNFWNNVCSQIYSMTETKLKLSPECCLLNISNYSLSKYKKINCEASTWCSRVCHPKHWKTTQVPTVAEWLHAVDSIKKNGIDCNYCFRKHWKVP